MTPLLEQAIARVGALPQDEQDAIASQILDSLADEEAWKKRFAEKPDILRRLAKEALEVDARGETFPLDDLLRPSRLGSSSLVFIDLPTSVYGEDNDGLRVTIHDEQDPPVANAGLPHALAFRQLSREPWIERVLGKLLESCPDAPSVGRSSRSSTFSASRATLTR